MTKPERCKAHLYVKKKSASGFVFKCTRCPHYVPEKFVDGHLAKCHYCGNDFIMHEKSHQQKPHCGCRYTVKMNNVKVKPDLAELVRKL